MSNSSLAASPLTAIGYRLTLLYIVLLVGRVPEITTVYLGTSLFQILVVTAVLMALVIITGILVKVGSTRSGAMWIAFHLWIIFTLPFSGYRRGSVDSLTSVLIYLPAVFFLGGFLIQSVDNLRRGFWAMAWAAVIGLAWMQITGVADSEDRFSSTGTFSNANLVAIYLLTAVPFWAYIVMNDRYRWATRLFFGGVIVAALISALRTGSRSGFITIGLLTLLMFFSVNVANKAKILVLGTLAVVLALAWMPETLKSRLGTVFSGQRTDDVAAEAVGSADQRYALLVESIETTVKHPFLGVGLGVYSAVNAREKEGIGEKALWQVSHNMYTQVSSEVGIPGFILYMTAFFWTIKSSWKVRKAAKSNPGIRELGLMSNVLLCSCAVFCFNGCFTSMALDYTLYILIGFSIATWFVYEDVMRQQVRSSTSEAPAAPVRSPRFFPAATASTVTGVVPAPSAPEPAVSNADAPWRRNPRKYPPKPGTLPR